MSRSRYRFGESPYPHFLTCTVVSWLPLFMRPELAALLFDSLPFLQARGRLTLLGYVVMENHLHLIAAAENLPKEIGDFKSFTARTIIDHLHEHGPRPLLDQLRALKTQHRLDRNYQVWQEGSHPQLIQDEAMLRQKLGYIHVNPVKRGYVDDPVHWRYSSARVYAGQPGLLEVSKDW